MLCEKIAKELFKLGLILFFFNLSDVAVPVAGFSLKSCRISRHNVICRDSGLRAVPEDIPATVEAADLSSNNITKIQASDFRNQTLMTQLNLNHNHIAQVDRGAFSGLFSLKKLSLSNNKLGRLGDIFDGGLSNLTDLRIASNGITSLSFTFFKSLTSLKTLDMSYNKLKHMKHVQSILQQLPHLRYLEIKQIGLTTFQSWELSNASIELTHLDLSQNQITVFRMMTDIFPNLRWLNIGGSPRKQKITWELQNETLLSRVATLDIGGVHLAFNDINMIFESFNFSLTSLKMKAMKYNLAALINTSCTIPTLSKLQLRKNGIKSVGSDMFHLCTNITELDLALNKMDQIHADSFRSLRGLQILRLNRCQLPSVPVAVMNLTTLEKLDLSYNNITSLGCGDFAKLTKLRELSLYNNLISSLKDCVFKDLIRLKVLRLQTNQMTTLNGAFKTYLPKLEVLKLNGNKLTALKQGVFEGLQSLQNLSLHENKITQFENGCFTGLTALTDIQLQSNNIKETEIRNGVFNVLSSLTRLDLRNNHIRYPSDAALPEPPFSQLSRLESLAIPAQHRKGKAQLPRNLLQGLTSLLVFDCRNIQILNLHEDTFNCTPQLQLLDISSNDLTDVSPKLFSPIRNLSSLYISRTSLVSLDFLIKAKLTKLEFMQARRNSFSVITEEVMNSVPALNYLDLQGNSFTCDCDNAWFLRWAENNNQTQVFDAYNFKCNYPKNLKGMKLLDLDVRSCSVDSGFIHFIFTTCAIFLLMSVSFTYHFLRWKLAYAYHLFLALLYDTRYKNKHAPHQYDAFISYNSHDEPWVFRELLPKLEGEQGWRLCLHHRDFQPGRSRSLYSGLYSQVHVT